MFANRIRNAALALAGATFLATALTTTIAAAPVAPGRVEHIRQIKLPGTFRHADLVVPPLGLAADAAVQNVEYRFRVTNNGPDTMTFKYDGRATWAVSRQDNGDQYGPSGYATRSPGSRSTWWSPATSRGIPRTTVRNAGCASSPSTASTPTRATTSRTCSAASSTDHPRVSAGVVLHGISGP
jgi:hypothetical protein